MNTNRKKRGIKMLCIASIPALLVLIDMVIFPHSSGTLASISILFGGIPSLLFLFGGLININKAYREKANNDQIEFTKHETGKTHLQTFDFILKIFAIAGIGIASALSIIWLIAGHLDIGILLLIIFSTCTYIGYIALSSKAMSSLKRSQLIIALMIMVALLFFI